MSKFGIVGLAALATARILLAAGFAAEPATGEWVETRSFVAPEATQAAAADEQFFYAIANRVVAKYDRQTEKLVARSTGEAAHLNSGFFHEGKLYLAHSNYPERPEHSEIKVLVPEAMELSTFHDFGASAGSLTWALFHDGAWWCNFAYYEDENSKTYLARLVDWRETDRWTYPAELIDRFARRSASGGVFRDGELLVTGHDEREIHVLEVPEEGDALKHLETIPAPFTGQGFAIDPATGGLVGIDRPRRKIVLAKEE